MDQLSNNLMKEIQTITQNINDYQEYEEYVVSYKYTEAIYENIKKRLRRQETYYDKLYESYSRCNLVIENSISIKKLLDEFYYRIEAYLVECTTRKEEIGNKLNGLLEEIKETERHWKETSQEQLTEEYEQMNYSSFKIETEFEKNKKKKKEQTKAKKDAEKRMSTFKGYLESDELIVIEEETKRFIEKRIFDSKVHKWTKGNCQLPMVKYHSHLIVVIETTEGKKFGCYIPNMISEIGKYIEDSNAFIFQLNGTGIQKYRINDSTRAIKICSEKEDDLLIIGNGDIVIKKHEMKMKCSCKQSSFDYHGKKNALLGKKGTFDIASIVFFETMNEEKFMKKVQEQRKYHKHKLRKMISYDQFKILENWTKKSIGEVIFDSSKDNWKKGTSTFHTKLMGRQHFILLIEEEENGNVFGAYIDVQMSILSTPFDKDSHNDPNAFVFSLESKGRLHYPMKFPIEKNNTDCAFWLFDDSFDNLCQCGYDIMLFKEKRKHDCCCMQNSFSRFEYQKIDNALIGSGFCFVPKRFVVVQMNDEIIQ